jgi:hypothetical protein
VPVHCPHKFGRPTQRDVDSDLVRHLDEREDLFVIERIMPADDFRMSAVPLNFASGCVFWLSSEIDPESKHF